MTTTEYATDTATSDAPPAFDPTALSEDSFLDVEMPTRTREGGARKYSEAALAPFVARLETGRPTALPAPAHQVKEIVGYVRAAGKRIDVGTKIAFSYQDNDGNIVRATKDSELPEDGREVLVNFQAKSRKQTGNKVECPSCPKSITVTAEGKVRKHNDQSGEVCAGSGADVVL